jgi:hypothetical protein
LTKVTRSNFNVFHQDPADFEFYFAEKDLTVLVSRSPSKVLTIEKINEEHAYISGSRKRIEKRADEGKENHISLIHSKYIDDMKYYDLCSVCLKNNIGFDFRELADILLEKASHEVLQNRTMLVHVSKKYRKYCEKLGVSEVLKDMEGYNKKFEDKTMAILKTVRGIQANTAVLIEKLNKEPVKTALPEPVQAPVPVEPVQAPASVKPVQAPAPSNTKYQAYLRQKIIMLLA